MNRKSSFSPEPPNELPRIYPAPLPPPGKIEDSCNLLIVVEEPEQYTRRITVGQLLGLQQEVLNTPCGYCGSRGKFDVRGNCGACGAPIKAIT